MSTINDVAREAGVSVATVSRALRGLDRVSPATRRRVLEVAEELQYVASPTATSLASGRTRVVAVAVPFLSRWFFATIVSAIERTLREQGHHVLLFDLEDDTSGGRLQLSQSMLWKRVDGVIALNVRMSRTELALVEQLGLPVVAVGTPIGGRPCVRIDDADAVRMAVEHLFSLGHTRIGYVGGVPVDDEDSKSPTPGDRLDFFRKLLADRGHHVPDPWLVDCDWTADAAAVACEPLLRSADRPTAILAGSDEMAIGVRETARRVGVSVPDDLSLIGIDDYALSAVLDLTTVRQDIAGQGRVAAEMMLSTLIEHEPMTHEVVLHPIELVVRGSTTAVTA